MTSLVVRDPDTGALSTVSDEPATAEDASTAVRVSVTEAQRLSVVADLRKQDEVNRKTEPVIVAGFDAADHDRRRWALQKAVTMVTHATRTGGPLQSRVFIGADGVPVVIRSHGELVRSEGASLWDDQRDARWQAQQRRRENLMLARAYPLAELVAAGVIRADEAAD